MRTSSWIVVTALPLLLVAAQQRPPPPKELPRPDVKVTPSPGARKEIARVTRELQGLWKLIDLDWPIIQNASTESRGFALVADNLISLEIHVGIFGPDQKIKNAMLDTGLWRYDIEEGNRIVLQAVIGSYLDQKNHIQFREPDVRHRYALSVAGDRMTLTHADGQKMVFERTQEGGQVERDAFGRPVKRKNADDADTPADGAGETKRTGGGGTGDTKHTGGGDAGETPPK